MKTRVFLLVLVISLVLSIFTLIAVHAQGGDELPQFEVIGDKLFVTASRYWLGTEEFSPSGPTLGPRETLEGEVQSFTIYGDEVFAYAKSANLFFLVRFGYDSDTPPLPESGVLIAYKLGEDQWLELNEDGVTFDIVNNSSLHWTQQVFNQSRTVVFGRATPDFGILDWVNWRFDPQAAPQLTFIGDDDLTYRGLDPFALCRDAALTGFALSTEAYFSGAEEEGEVGVIFSLGGGLVCDIVDQLLSDQ